MSLLIPSFLGGLVLLVLPILIHQIRRPERQVVKFSSLMFVPAVKKEVIERRKLQHLLLLLMRILLLLLMILAFSRPYQTYTEPGVHQDQAPENHLILIDTSHSMSLGETFQAGQQQASQILDELGSQVRVGLVAFDHKPRKLTSLEQGDAASTQTATREAIEGLSMSQHASDYLKALRYAESLLLTQMGEEAVEQTSVLHMISDFRANGMPDQLPGWRLSSRIRFEPHQVGPDQFENLSLTAVAVRTQQDGSLTVAGRVKSYRSEESRITLTLKLEGMPQQQKTLTVAAGNASLLGFPLQNKSDQQLMGSLEIEDDAFPGDNRRFILYQPDPGKRIWIVGDRTDFKQYGAAWFMEKALATAAGPVWRTQRLRANTIAKQFHEQPAPDALILASHATLDAANTRAVADYVAQGGRLLLCLDERAAETPLLRRLGLTKLKPRFAETRVGQYSPIAWVNFEHPLFFAFRAARFNDFSGLRFQNYMETELPAKAVVLARFETEQAAMAELSLEQGKAILWFFRPTLAWSNLPKHVKFVPLLQETMGYLTQRPEAAGNYLVGNPFPLNALQSKSGTYYIQSADGRERAIERREDLTQLTLEQAGYVRFREHPEQAWRAVSAVNIDSREGDPQRLPPQEFALKLTSNSNELGGSPQGNAKQRERQAEFGALFLKLMAILLIAESYYAVALSARRHKPGTALNQGGAT